MAEVAGPPSPLNPQVPVPAHVPLRLPDLFCECGSYNCRSRRCCPRRRAPPMWDKRNWPKSQASRRLRILRHMLLPFWFQRSPQCMPPRQGLARASYGSQISSGSLRCLHQDISLRRNSGTLQLRPLRRHEILAPAETLVKGPFYSIRSRQMSQTDMGSRNSKEHEGESISRAEGA